MVFHSLFEFTIDQWKGHASRIIKRTASERGKLRGREATITRFVAVEGNPSSPILVFLTEPTYDFNVPIIRPGAGAKQGVDNLYDVRIQLLDLSKWRSGKYLYQMTLDEFKEILDVVEVKLQCSCLHFHWGGPRYQLSQLDSAIWPTGIADPIWRKRHGTAPTLCKHLLRIIPLIKFNAPTLLKSIKQKYSKKG